MFNDASGFQKIFLTTDYTDLHRAMGVWKVVQSLGEQVCEEKQQLVEAHKKGILKGTKEAPVLFEEADGVYVKLQGKDRKISHQKKVEINVGIAYDGWKKEGKDRYRLEK